MEYILNEIPIKTTNNFNINNLKIKLDIPTNLEFKKYKSNIDIKYNIIDNFDSKIGLKFNKSLSIDINIKDKINDNIELLYEFNNNDTLIDTININYLENSEANIIIKYKSLDNNKHFHHLKENLNVSKNAKGSITILNLLNNKSTNLVSIETNIDDNSIITHNLIDLGSNIKINNIYSIVNNNSKSILNNIYLGLNNDIIDMNYNYINKGIKSTNIIESQGVLNNKSTKKFRGTIDFIKGCSESIGSENENCVLLSDDSVSSSVPILLCGEENVIGNHSVSSGKIDENKLFYLMSRGLDLSESKKLIIMSNFNKIINNITDERTKEEILNIIEKVSF